ncbi:hypothetical protein Sjap_015115 [Stephania japonica]|uniref:DUF7910 domain-containing protein n=1 Tax=Stephania japonica TaxID=461633 RepID=A0AAP0NR31_9MAGN
MAILCLSLTTRCDSLSLVGSTARKVRSDLLNFFVSALDLDILCLRDGTTINGDERARFEALEEEKGTRGVKVSQKSEEQMEDQNPNYEPTELAFFHAVVPPGTINMCTEPMIWSTISWPSHFLAIRKDVETKGNLIRSIFEKIRAAIHTDIEDVLYLVDWLDNNLSSSADEIDVLKHFNWPERKVDAMQEVAIEYRDLKRLASDVRNFIGLDTQGDGVTLVAIWNITGASQVFEFVRKDDDQNCVHVIALNGNFLQVRSQDAVFELAHQFISAVVSHVCEGEAIIRGTLTRDVAAVMEYKGLKLQEAVDWVVKNMLDGDKEEEKGENAKKKKKKKKEKTLKPQVFAFTPYSHQRFSCMTRTKRTADVRKAEEARKTEEANKTIAKTEKCVGRRAQTVTRNQRSWEGAVIGHFSVLADVSEDDWLECCWKVKMRLAGPVAERHVAGNCAGEFARVSPKFWETVWMRISRQIDELERGDGCACPRGGS